MYEKKLPFDIDCGIRIAMEVIGGKWKSCIIFELAEGPKRPSELHRLFPEANSRVIDQQLKRAESLRKRYTPGFLRIPNTPSPRRVRR